ncbi:MAG: hypothetical protein RJB14_2186 [Pseudomonadota bacterium]
MRRPRSATAQPSSTDARELDPGRCYQAMADRDAAWDGLFFTGVTSTGIYCRPVCRVRLPKAANCRFFETPAQAESQGFRPCLRCRPELAPARRHWSNTDAQQQLAQIAADLLQGALRQGQKPRPLRELANELGVSDRHLRRVFESHWQVSPVQFLQTQRLLLAKQWLHDTHWPMSQVAQASGFGSTRRMYAAFAQQYRLSPAQLRPPKRQDPTDSTDSPQGQRLTLHYRPPYQHTTLWQFFRERALDGMESWQSDGRNAKLRRTICWPHGPESLQGWLQVCWDTAQACVHLLTSASLMPVLPDVVAQVRDWLDLDADPAHIHHVLGKDFPHALGLRLPGGLDGFELAVRAILGQQITVKAARTLGQRLVNVLGTPCETPWPGLNRTFPTPTTLAKPEHAALMGSLGVVRQRQQAIQALAQAVLTGALDLRASAPLASTLDSLMRLPGIGPWTAHYVAMRALRWTDAWPVQDVALQTALGVRQDQHPGRALELLGQAWQPYRSYALIAAWQTLSPSPS